MQNTPTPDVETKMENGPEITTAFDDFMRAFESFKQANDERLTQLETRMGSDVVTDEDGHFIYTEREDLSDVASALEGKFGEVEAKSTKLIWKPQNMVPIAGDDAEKLMRLLDVLDDLDDVANIYDNSDISAEELERLAE